VEVVIAILDVLSVVPDMDPDVVAVMTAVSFKVAAADEEPEVAGSAIELDGVVETAMLVGVADAPWVRV
jgi:hypothetical protein